MFNAIRGHKPMPLLICNFTARQAAQQLRTEWQGGGLVTSVLSQATKECLQYPSIHKHFTQLSHKPLRKTVNQFDKGNSIHSKRIISFINTIKPRVRLITFHSTTRSN